MVEHLNGTASRLSLSGHAAPFSRNAVDAGLLLQQAQMDASAAGASIREYDIHTNGVCLHITEQGAGPVVIFCHGFPDTSYSWREQMRAVAAAGYRAIAPDMRGYGRSSCPADKNLYTPLHTTGDLVGLLDALKISDAVLVGHDWGASHAWSAALLRPDRFSAVFALSVPFIPRGELSVFDRMRQAGRENDFYMFEQMRAEANEIWADATVTIPGVLYWASGTAPANGRWSPLDRARSLYRPAPLPSPVWVDPQYIAHNIAEFQRTGFHGGLNYYRAAEPWFHLSAPWKGAKIMQPSFFIWGNSDGQKEFYPFSMEQIRAGIPNLVDGLELDGVGHWVHHEAREIVNGQLVRFLNVVCPV